MPFFGSRHSPEPAPVQAAPAPAPPPEKKHGLFHRSHNSTDTSPISRNSSLSSDGHHNSNRRTSGNYAASSTTSTSGRGSLLSRSHGHGSRGDEIDPSIAAARERVMSAEAAEKDADRAMAEARRRVRDAKEHVKRLEEEAREEARRAMIKQEQAREVSKRGKGLGRELFPPRITQHQSLMCNVQATASNRRVLIPTGIFTPLQTPPIREKSRQNYTRRRTRSFEELS